MYLDDVSIDRHPMSDQNDLGLQSAPAEDPTPRRRPGKKRVGFLRWVLRLFLIFLLVGEMGFFVGMVYVSRDIPSLRSIKDYRPFLITTVYANDRRTIIAEFYRERRILIPLAQSKNPSPALKMLQDAFVAAEDAKFWVHAGISPRAILRAALANIQAGSIVQGGSTITQQVAKMLILTPRKTFTRKLREAVLAYHIEQQLTKNEILHIYLNQVYLGYGSYGVESAAENYFGKTVHQLTLPEVALLAGLTKAPGNDSPPDCLNKRIRRCLRQKRRGCDPSDRRWLDQAKRTCLHEAKKRQLYVLERMVTEGKISREQYDQARNSKIVWASDDDRPSAGGRPGEDNVIYIRRRRSKFQTFAPYFVEHVREYLINKYGKHRVETDGLKVYTTVDIKLTTEARRAITKGLHEYDERKNGYRGPRPKLDSVWLRRRPWRWRKIAEQIKAMDRIASDKDWRPGQIKTARITGFDPRRKKYTARLGAVQGVIPYQHWKWAISVDHNSSPYWYFIQRRWYPEWRRKNHTPVLKGDVVLVRLVKKQPDGSWVLHLTQELTRKPPDGPDWGLNQPEIQSALVSIQTKTGHVKVLIGGRSWQVTQLNRATHPQAVRQPGSSFKPFIYTTGLLHNIFTPASPVFDGKIAYKHKGGSETWRPSNYDHKHLGWITYRQSIQRSRNLSTIWILDRVGPDRVIQVAKKFGITTPLINDLSLGLGASDVHLFELTRAYSVFANGGRLIEPVMILKVVDRHGKVLEEVQPQPGLEAIDPATNYLMVTLLRAVVTGGTGARANKLKQFACGKTGTTNKHIDAWFMGFTPRLVTGVWVGHDEPRNKLGRGETGGKTALPIWLAFMQQAVGSDPIEPFPRPSGVVSASVRVRLGPGQGKLTTVSDVFKAGHVERSQKGDGGGSFFMMDVSGGGAKKTPEKKAAPGPGPGR
ncbi:MAG: transglycosylase domain-containing protein [Proteobacteria bacterium]|nr:transglycosylase domain-containing protein [Pseudomonadota bacterium]